MATNKGRPKLEDEILFEIPTPTRGSGRDVPRTFVPETPNSTPTDLFPTRSNIPKTYMERFTHKKDYSKVLIYVEGAARYPGDSGDKNSNTNNNNNNRSSSVADDEGRAQAVGSGSGSGGPGNDGSGTGTPPRGGWAYMYGPTLGLHVYGGRLEQRGPFGGDAVVHHTLARTRGRAALRGVLAALRCRPWAQDGYTTLVVATGSAYVVRGATAGADGVRRWTRQGWTTRERVLAHGEGEGRLDEEADVPDRDLWEAVLGEVERYAAAGLRVEFWQRGSDEGSNAIAMHKAGECCNGSDSLNFHEVPAAGF